MSTKHTDRKLASTLLALASKAEEGAILNAQSIGEQHKKKADRVVEACRVAVKKAMRLREAVK